MDRVLNCPEHVEVSDLLSLGIPVYWSEVADLPNGKDECVLVYQAIQTFENELLVVAVPVYMRRVPALLSDWLHTITADNTPTVCIVVYGNRVYDDALLELKDILKKCGCIPIACVAYIGEHSFSSSEIPIAEARPDASDLNHAELFGRKVTEKLLSISSIAEISDINLHRKMYNLL